MINHVEIIPQPYSGEYKEIIYDDTNNSWRSSSWAWIKFTDDNGYEWVGSFKGEAISVALSNKYRTVLILTSDYLFQFDKDTGNLVTEDYHMSYYQGLTISPVQDFIVCDYSSIYKIKDNIDERIELKIPISVSLVDYIKLKEWKNDKLHFTCEEPTPGDCYLCDLEYDSTTDAITLLGKTIL